jgi:hypothetical protein
LNARVIWTSTATFHSPYLLRRNKYKRSRLRDPDCVKRQPRRLSDLDQNAARVEQLLERGRIQGPRVEKALRVLDTERRQQPHVRAGLDARRGLSARRCSPERMR